MYLILMTGFIFNTYPLYYLMRNVLASTLGWRVLDNAMTCRTSMSCSLLRSGYNNYALGTLFVVFRSYGGFLSGQTLMAGTWCCCWVSRIIRFNTSYNIDYECSLWCHYGRLNSLGSLWALMVVLKFTRKLRRLVCNNNIQQI